MRVPWQCLAHPVYVGSGDLTSCLFGKHFKTLSSLCSPHTSLLRSRNAKCNLQRFSPVVNLLSSNWSCASQLTVEVELTSMRRAEITKFLQKHLIAVVLLDCCSLTKCLGTEYLVPPEILDTCHRLRALQSLLSGTSEKPGCASNTYQKTPMSHCSHTDLLRRESKAAVQYNGLLRARLTTSTQLLPQ